MVFVIAVGVLLAEVLPTSAAADAPTISDVSPGRSGIGGTVVISGSGFTGTTGVSFNGVAATFTESSDEQVSAVVPAGALTGPITVEAKAGSVSSADFVVQPDIILILTDDQRYDETRFMPVVSSQLADKGVTFNEGFVVNPLCCPSRISILTGKYSHSTRIYTNSAPNGGF